MLKHIRPAFVMVALMTALTILYTLGVTGISQVVFPKQAMGSLIERDGKIVGSDLIGQAFTSDRYFRSRSSATVAADPADASKTVASPNNASNSAGSNLAPTSKTLMDRVQGDIAKYQEVDAIPGRIPADLVTTSASGLDPHISPENAELQIARVARVRNLDADRVRALVADATEKRTLGFLGEPRVNVLKLNLALDGEKAAAVATR